MPARRSRSGWSKAKIVERIKMLHSKGADLSYNRMARRAQSLLAAANYHFGSWAAAVEAAGLDYAGQVRRIPKWTRERIIARIREARRQGVDLSWTSVTRSSRYSALAYAAVRKSTFGSWDGALEAAGVDPADVRRYESWSKDRIVARVKERARRGLALNSKAIQDEDPKLFNAALNYFGGWDKALEAADIRPEDVYLRRRWTAESVKGEIRRLARSGQDLSASAVSRKHPDLYGAARKCFGSWAAAREACGLKKA